MKSKDCTQCQCVSTCNDTRQDAVNVWAYIETIDVSVLTHVIQCRCVLSESLPNLPQFKEQCHFILDCVYGVVLYFSQVILLSNNGAFQQ